ncbi:MAG: hypothetical protein QOI91_1397 [Solirubrobacteraceae bacterium]|jgi:hypothetical protein|nr:hypothetical protein [Solirubrobacteraceae bacterium]
MEAFSGDAGSNSSIEGEPVGFASSSDLGFSDSVTLAFGDPSVDVYGLARIGVTPGDGTASALGILFSGGDVVESVAEGGVSLSAADWSSISAGGLELTAEDGGWRLRWDGAVDLRFEAISPALEQTGAGMEGHEQLCRVAGTATAGGAQRRIDCLGQRGRSWGVADWDRVALARTVCAWWDDRALVLGALRPAKAREHDREELSAWLLEEGFDPREVAEPRLSTTYDAEGRQRRAGLELFVTGEDDEFPRRVAGEVACGTSLDLGRLRLDCAFFSWRMEGRAGVGRYDVLRRT